MVRQNQWNCVALLGRAAMPENTFAQWGKVDCAISAPLKPISDVTCASGITAHLVFATSSVTETATDSA